MVSRQNKLGMTMTKTVYENGIGELTVDELEKATGGGSPNGRVLDTPELQFGLRSIGGPDGHKCLKFKNRKTSSVRSWSSGRRSLGPAAIDCLRLDTPAKIF